MGWWLVGSIYTSNAAWTWTYTISQGGGEFEFETAIITITMGFCYYNYGNYRGVGVGFHFHTSISGMYKKIKKDKCSEQRDPAISIISNHSRVMKLP
jgi:hypothetical protein